MSEEEQLSRRCMVWLSSHPLVATLCWPFTRRPRDAGRATWRLHESRGKRRGRRWSCCPVVGPDLSRLGLGGNGVPGSGSPFSADTLPHATVAPVQDDLATLRAAPFWFQRTVTQVPREDSGAPSLDRSSILGLRGTAVPPADKVKRLALGIATFTGNVNRY